MNTTNTGGGLIMAETVITGKQKNQNKMHPFIKKIFRQITIYIVSLGIVAATVIGLGNMAYSKLLQPVDENDKSTTTVEIPMGTSVRGIADILYKNDLIRNKGVFKIFVDISDKSSKLKAGRYKLSKNMNIQQILDELISGEAAIGTARITIREGLSIREMASYISELKNEDKKVFNFTAQDFIDAAKEVDNFSSEYPFLLDIPEERKNGEYPLEGYLFPDTYIVYLDSKPDDIIKKMLSTFENKIYNAEFQTVPLITRLEELDMTVDEAVILASVVQMEAAIKDEFFKISAVFHNRLKIDMLLGSCATVQYALGSAERKPFLTDKETSIDSPYNTYKYQGLPIGPIASPGQLAMEAVLYPYEEFMNTKNPMLYFVYAGDSGHVFSTNAKDHAKAKQKYEKLWKESQDTKE
jgi:UPF0755 protein